MTDKTVSLDQLIERFNGHAIFEDGTQLNGTEAKNAIDVVLAWNAVNDLDLSVAVGFTPQLFRGIQATARVPSSVQNEAGPLDW